MGGEPATVCGTGAEPDANELALADQRRTTGWSVEARQKVFERATWDEHGCLVWHGSLAQGYGVVYFARRNWYTHRLMYEANRGPIEDGLQIDHLCRNRACCNPEHLEPVTTQENTARGILGQIRFASHCSHGHEFTPENTAFVGRARERRCRTCSVERTKEWREKKRAERLKA